MLGVWNTPLVGLGTKSINHKKYTRFTTQGSLHKVHYTRFTTQGLLHHGQQNNSHLPNLSIQEFHSDSLMRHVPNLSVSEPCSLAKLDHFRDILAKLEHSRDKFTCQTWVLPVPRHTHLPNMNIQETYSFAKFLHSSDKLAAKHECSWDNIYCIYIHSLAKPESPRNILTSQTWVFQRHRSASVRSKRGSGQWGSQTSAYWSPVPCLTPRWHQESQRLHTTHTRTENTRIINLS